MTSGQLTTVRDVWVEIGVADEDVLIRENIEVPIA
jgi:hypothetical protein